MIEKVLLIGGKIEIQREKKHTGTEQKKERVYISQLMDIIDETRIQIAMPVEAGKLILLDVGERFHFYFYSPAGLYHCIGKVDNRYKSKQLFIAEIVFLSELEKYQRRQFYRLNCILDMTYSKKTTPEDVKKGLIIDISAGGVRFNSEERYQPGDELQLSFQLQIAGKIKPMIVMARVLTSEPLLHKEKSNENRLEFIDISSDGREKIVKYIFEEERKRRRRDSGLS